MIDPSDTLLIKEVVKVASPLIKGVVDKFVLPKLERFTKRFELDRKKYYVPTVDHFNEYLHRTYKRVSVINTLVFSNSQKLLKNIYQPLTLTIGEDGGKKFKIKTFPLELVKEYEKLLITDTAGMGKSTLMKTFFMSIIDNQIGIPILIDLRRLSKEKKIVNEIQEQLNSLDRDFDSQLLMELLAEGGFFIILDGYDEISLTDREIVTVDLQNFISKADKNYFVITSRPEQALSSFGNFREFSIEPLKIKEAFELLRKYDGQGENSKLLIKKLEETEMSNVNEFLTNPLLVSLLFTAFEHKQAIPFKKYLFYRQVYDANFEAHDLTKGDSYIHDKHSKLEIDDFHRVLRHIGYSCLKLQKIEFTKDEILKLICDSRVFCVGLKFGESDFLSDLISSVPLFTQDGNYYRWSHKSLQEYFAAQFIYLDAKSKQNDILMKLYEHKNLEKFVNILDMYYDMDYKCFRNVIIYKFLQDYREYFTTQYQANYPGVKVRDLISRVEMTFLTSSFLFKGPAFDDEANHSEILDNVIFTREAEQLKVGKQWNGILMSNEYSNGIYCMNFTAKKFVMLSFLKSKRNPIIKIDSRFEDEKVNEVLITYEFENELQELEINDSIENPLNSSEHFVKVNEIIEWSRLDGLFVHHKNSLDTLKEIENDLKLEEGDDFLIEDF